jgi:acyl-coenzyme A thioesterase PaaI-like protein
MVRLQLDPRPELENSWGSARRRADDPSRRRWPAGRSLDENCNGALTVEMKVNFIAAATGRVLGEGRAQRAGRSLIFSEGELRGEDGTLPPRPPALCHLSKA